MHLFTFLPRGMCPSRHRATSHRTAGGGAAGTRSPEPQAPEDAPAPLIPRTVPPHPAVVPAAAHHFLQQHVAIFGQLDVPGPRHQPAGDTIRVSERGPQGGRAAPSAPTHVRVPSIHSAPPGPPASAFVPRRTAPAGTASPGRPRLSPHAFPSGREGRPAHPPPQTPAGRCGGVLSHLHGALRAQVGPQHILEPAGRADVHGQRGLGTGHLRFGVERLHRHGRRSALGQAEPRGGDTAGRTSRPRPFLEHSEVRARPLVRGRLCRVPIGCNACHSAGPLPPAAEAPVGRGRWRGARP